MFVCLSLPSSVGQSLLCLIGHHYVGGAPLTPLMHHFDLYHKNKQIGHMTPLESGQRPLAESNSALADLVGETIQCLYMVINYQFNLIKKMIEMIIKNSDHE